MNNISRFQFTISCDTQEKVNLFKDVLEKTINESSIKINREQAMSIVFKFYLENEKSSNRSRELIRRTEYEKKKTWKNELTEEIRKQEHQLINSQIKHILNIICNIEKEELRNQIGDLINTNVDLRVEYEKMKNILLIKFKDILKPIQLEDE